MWLLTLPRQLVPISSRLRGTMPVDSGNLTSSVSFLQPGQHLNNQFPALNSLSEIRDWILTDKMNWCNTHFGVIYPSPWSASLRTSSSDPWKESRKPSVHHVAPPHPPLWPLLTHLIEDERSDLSSRELEHVTLNH